jgi:hypothetical protein
MSSLLSAIDELRTRDPEEKSDEELEADVSELERAAETLYGELLRQLTEVDRRGPWARDGYLSTSAWLVDRFRMSWSEATKLVRTARALAHMPRTREALAAGDVPPSAVQVLVGAQESHPEEFPEMEAALVEAASILSLRELRRAVAHWSQAVDWHGALGDAERARERRRLHVSSTLGGTVRVDGDLDPDTGQTLLAALRAVLDAEAHGPEVEDPRTPAQRRADALGEICRRWLDGSERPSVGGERPHVTVMVDIDALEGRPGGVSEFDDTAPVHPEIARRWACDASVTRVVMQGASEILDVGRRTPVVSGALRRAVVVRDRHCRFPGCDRPHTWCDAHHVVHWADGGSTALANLVLLCRRHHRLVHEPGGFWIDIAESRPRFRRPDGTPLEDRAPP